MSFNDQKRLDPSQVQDRRGRSTGRTVLVGGGGLGLILLLVSMFLGIDPSALLGAAEPQTGYAQEPAALASECRTGADANSREDCQLVGFVNSIQAFWADELPQYGVNYVPAQTVLFSGSTEAACGFASSASGPFYCQRDRTVYVDLSFFDTILTRLGARGGPLATAYVIAHEYGHHVQNLFGVLNTSGAIQDTGPESDIVFTELQADCLAGIWMSHATETGYLSSLTRDEILQALDAAVSVGDDRIQQQTQGYIVPDAWTHGSSQQRLDALQDGLNSGDIESCNTPGW
ncbi:MAG: neutral zinc metallopeptidase [Anaerolineales bacterium]|jgi:predicted metalloprotease|nr:neutral zinc metallopeptidase [Anaerolineales bacterium]MBX3004471.1 neutral zinc metallopeptidase [Anaerolineales bacterium]MCW5887366.1 neutral zinc metallopeptidase [Anaerolineales bacterium]